MKKENIYHEEFYECLSDAEKEFFISCIEDKNSSRARIESTLSALRSESDKITESLQKSESDYLADISRLKLTIKEFSGELGSLGKGTVWAYSPSEKDKKVLLKKYYAHIGKVSEYISLATVPVSVICKTSEDILRFEAKRFDAERDIFIFSAVYPSEKDVLTQKLPPQFNEKEINRVFALAAENEKAAGRYVSALEKAFDALGMGENMNIGLAIKICLAAFSEISDRTT